MNQSTVEICLGRSPFQPDTRPARPPAPGHDRLPRNPARPDNIAATPDGPAHERQATERSPACRAATVKRLPGAAAHSPARITMLDGRPESLLNRLCASFVRFVVGT